MSSVELFADGKSMGVFEGEFSVEVPAKTRRQRRARKQKRGF